MPYSKKVEVFLRDLLATGKSTILPSFFKSKNSYLSAQNVIKLLEPLCHRERVQIMVLLGVLTLPKGSRINLNSCLEKDLNDLDSSTLSSAIEDLAKGSIHERSLALLSCLGSKNNNIVAKLLNDPSRLLRYKAMNVAPYICLEDQILSILKTLPRKDRNYFLAKLKSAGSTNVVDRFIELEIERNTPTIWELLPYCSYEYLDLNWDKFYPFFTTKEWIKIANHHADLALSRLISWVSSGERVDWKLLKISNAVMHVTAEINPSACLELVQLLALNFRLDQILFSKLLPFRPVEITKLINSCSEIVSTNLDSFVSKFDLQMIKDILSKHNNCIKNIQTVLESISPDKRSSLFLEFKESWREYNGSINPGILKLLPTKLRHSEATKYLELPHLQTQPHVRLKYAGLLSWHECKIIVEPYLNNPDIDLRALAIRELIQCIRFDKDLVADMLMLLGTKTREAEPVFASALIALSELPPSLWKNEYLEPLGEIIREALNMKDLSYQSLQALSNLVVGLMPFSPSWASSWWLIILKERGPCFVNAFESKVNATLMLEISETLSTALTQWQNKEHWDHITTFAGNLSCRIKNFPELLDSLETLISNSVNVRVSERALTLLHSHARERFNQIVPKVLKEDPSWSLNQLVINFLHRTRQDLLTPFLGQQAVKGLYSTGKIRIVPSFDGGFLGWNQLQLNIYTESLKSMLSENDENVSHHAYAISKLALLPEPSVDTLLKLSRTNDPKKMVLRDLAIQSLASLDSKEGIPELLKCLGDDRAKSAIYPIRTAILNMDREIALEILTGLTNKEITVRKEIIRLIGELNTESAYVELIKLSKQPLQRDLKISLIRALWSFLNKDETWCFFETIAMEDDPTLLKHLAKISSDGLSQIFYDRLIALLSRLLGAKDAGIKLAVMKRLCEEPILDPNHKLLNGISEAFSSNIADLVNTASQTILAIYSATDAEAIRSCIEKNLAKRLNLNTFVASLIKNVIHDRKRNLDTAHAIISILELDALTIGLAVKIAALALEFDEYQLLISKINTSGNLHAGVLAEVLSSLYQCNSRTDSNFLKNITGHFSTHSSEALRRIGLGALEACCSKNGWSEADLDQLNQLRHDKSPLVASAAQFIFPNNE